MYMHIVLEQTPFRAALQVAGGGSVISAARGRMLMCALTWVTWGAGRARWGLGVGASNHGAIAIQLVTFAVLKMVTTLRK